jgi:solute carrier family 25, member 38
MAALALAATTSLAAATSPAPDRVERLVAGLIAGVLSALLLQPVEVIKTRTQANSRVGTVDTVKRLLRDDGAKALWAGVMAQVVRLGGGIALYFVFLGEAERLIREAFGPVSGTMSMLSTMLIGMVSRGAAMVIFCPINVLKTRAEAGFAKSGQQGSLLHELILLARVEGRHGLFAGLGAALLRDLPYSGLNLVLMRLFRGTRPFTWLPGTASAALSSAASASCATLVTRESRAIQTRARPYPCQLEPHRLCSLASVARRRLRVLF